MPILNSLPRIVNGPGWYLLRNGKRAHVHNIVENPNPETTTFGVKGTTYKQNKKGKYVPAGYNIWHVSGRCYVLNESGRDIVSKIEGN